MKKTNALLLLLTPFMVLLASCGKQGPIGPMGVQGATGATGATGAAGTNGTQIYSGQTTPATSIGAAGDFYIDLATGALYGPKTSSGWGTPISLVGPAGANGSTIYSGTTAPTASIGAIGDFYIDTANGTFFGPKTANGWGNGFLLVANALGGDFPTVINTIVTPAIIDTLQAHGTIIYPGLLPPTVSGTYLVSPNYCLFDNSGNGDAGDVFDNYEYEFSSQVNSTFTIKVNYSDAIAGGDDSGSDLTATYLSGAGSLFTIYAQVTGTESGIAYTELQVISGQVAQGQINGFQLTIYVESKGSDPDNLLAPVGTLRIFEDEDGVSPLQSTFDSGSSARRIPALSLRDIRKLALSKRQ
jgi:hypothetical protein